MASAGTMVLMATEFRLKPLLQPLGAGAHLLQAGDDAPCILQHSAAFIRQLRLAHAAALEQRHFKLRLEIGDGVADHRLGAIERA